MDFGVGGFDGLGGSNTGFASLTNSSPDQEAKHKWYGSGFHKQGGRSAAPADEDWRSSKMAKTDDFSAPKTMLRSNNNSSHFSDGQQQLLSFSNSSNSEAAFVEKSSQNATFPYFHQALSAYNRAAAGQNTGGFNGGTMHWAIAGARGPFTPSQWMELEHQALIYKYITANVPIPSNLLIPIKKAFDSAGFSTFPNGLLRRNTLGWGSIHLGFSNNNDPEPGRCRRTDGKKWRCWRDAVPDQKYCERHMNRGRHRSRKPVEGQTGRAVAGTTTTTTTTSKQLMPLASSSPTSSVPMPGGGGSSSLSIANQQLKSLQPAASNSSAATQMSRMFINKESVGERMQQHTSGLSMLSKENPFLIQKQQMGGYEESSRTEFGLVPSDSLLNPSQKGSSLMSCRNFGSSSQNLTDPAETNSQQHSLRHFIDDWPKNQSDRVAVSWPDQLDMQSDRTQLSISIPIASSDFVPSTSSTNNEKLALSPLRLSRELDPVPMGLGVGSVLNEQNIKQANWIPITWETSLGGPLGEVLHHTNNNNAAECKSSVLNLMTEGWDKNSPSLGSSPTGVLQKTAFGSLSNSSAGSSPRAEHRTHEGVSFCNDLLGSNMLNSSSLPAL